MSPNRFVLQFALSDLAGLATRYGYRQDEGAFAAGRNIVNGNYGRENLKVIVRWKSARKIGFIDDNTDAEIAHALRFASAPGISENSAVEILDKLHGVGVPMASAILTTIRPDKYTIIDFRALEALGITRWPSGSVRFYLDYLRECRELARKLNVDLRTLDRALWQWSKEHGKSRSACA